MAAKLPRWLQRLQGLKRQLDGVAARVEALDIAEVNPNCTERRRAYKAAGLTGGGDR